MVARVVLIGWLASGVAACKQDGPANLALQQPRGASVAFDTIDGLPRPQFQTLVERLNDEAQSRRLAVVSREGTSAYRVRGALTATVNRGQTTIAWTWDVFDGAEQRVLQIKGEETGTTPTRKTEEAWKVADDAMLRRIAQTSMDKLSAFLTSPDVTPNAAAAPAMAFDSSSPEAAGIYRIQQSNADPVPAAPAVAKDAETPLPQKRPAATHAARQMPAATLAMAETGL
ncbi:hypothetical protein [Undibacter mobilis]|uniref:Lipoprotein n=1 Tax=Undibacter mobilis TaxID=2292256 RepID=A0A371BB03_9BRAD|nr:hypothetical protein [Undibacter mobilis]RDV04805.1 hypothetical protein DXH78_09665 [Undibacter mobilis]